MIMFVYFLHMYAYTYTYKIHPSKSVDKNEISTYKCNMVTVSSSRVISKYRHIIYLEDCIYITGMFRFQAKYTNILRASISNTTTTL